MVNPVKNQPGILFEAAPKKKKPKEIDVRIKKAVKKTKTSSPSKAVRSLKISQKIAAKQAVIVAEKASYTARQRAIETKRAAVLAQKRAFLAQRAHMAQQAAAAKRAQSAEKAKKVAQKAAKKTNQLRRVAKIKAYLARPEEKKRGKLLKKYIPSNKKKKKQ